MFTDIYSLTESVVGSALIIWGLALLINKHILQSFVDTFTNIEDNETLSYLTASMFLILGLITTAVHNDWYWSSSLIVTLIGWILILKAGFWLFFPKIAARLAKKMSHLILSSWFRFVSAGGIIFLGLIVLGKYYMESLSPLEGINL